MRAWAGGVLSGKISGTWPLGVKEKRESGARAQKILLITPFFPKKTPCFCTEIGHLYTKGCKNEEAEVKESKQNCRELRVHAYMQLNRHKES